MAVRFSGGQAGGPWELFLLQASHPVFPAVPGTGLELVEPSAYPGALRAAGGLPLLSPHLRSLRASPVLVGPGLPAAASGACCPQQGALGSAATVAGLVCLVGV